MLYTRETRPGPGIDGLAGVLMPMHLSGWSVHWPPPLFVKVLEGLS